MLRTRPSFRVFALLWAVLQLALPGAVSVLDGATALRNDVDVVAHVEATSGQRCQPPHSAECGVCRYLSAGGINDARLGTPEWPRSTADAASKELPGFAAAPATASPLARAPPLA